MGRIVEDRNSHDAQDALRRAKFKLPGLRKDRCQQMFHFVLPVPKQFVVDVVNCLRLLSYFTKFNRNDYVKLKAENKIMPDGESAKLLLTDRQPGRAFLAATA